MSRAKKPVTAPGAPRPAEPDGLGRYRANRDFAKTSEPSGDGRAAGPSPAAGVYVVQKHRAGRLHYDLRLESGGVLKSWAVPKGPSLDPADKRLAVAVEDHPLDYAGFEGEIPEGEYGAGSVIVWDRGTFRPQGDATLEEMLQRGAAKIEVVGDKLRGGFALVRTAFGGRRDNWLLIKEKDAHARPGSDVTVEEPQSVVSGRDVDAMGGRTTRRRR